MSVIILGVTGSIAAYKAADIASQLTKKGHAVHCICTEMALEFVTPLALQTMSRNPVLCGFADEGRHWPPPHIDLAASADLFVIAPATANTIAQMANGLAPNLLTSAYLACSCRVLICPAMNERMWTHQATRNNIEQLSLRHNHVIFGPDNSGMLACGEPGKGRMMPVERILACIDEQLQNLH